MRRTAVAVAMALAVTGSTTAGAAAAFAQPSLSAAHSPAGKPVKPGKPSRPAKFAASGTITAVAAADGTVTVAVKGGTKDVRGTTVTVTVPSTARISVNGVAKSLSDIAAGYRVTVVGVRTGTNYTAVRVQARGPKVRPAPVPPTSDDPAPEPGESPSAEPAHS